MARILAITFRDLKGQTGSQPLTGLDLIVGPNGAGKTARIQALAVALLGYAPGQGRTPAEVSKLASADEMQAGLECEGFAFTRTFVRSVRTKRTGEQEISVSQDITLSPARQERTLAERQARIVAELGNFPVMLDFGEFVGLSDQKRREFIYALAGDAAAWDKDRVRAYLGERVLTPELQVLDPDRYAALDELIGQALNQWPAGYDVQAGLAAMLEWVRAQQSLWAAEARRALGAAQKLAELRRNLADTDRGLAEAKAQLDRLTQDLVTVEAELARGRERLRQIEQARARRDELRRRLAALQAEPVEADTADLDRQIEELTRAIRDVDPSEYLQALDGRRAGALEEIARLEQAIDQARREAMAVERELAAYRQAVERIESPPTDSQGQRLCVISPEIACPKDFTRYLAHAKAQIQSLNARLQHADQQRQALEQSLQQAREHLRAIDEERSAVIREAAEQQRQNEQRRRQIASLEQERQERRNAARLRADQIKLVTEELQRLESEPPVALGAPIDVLEKQAEALRAEMDRVKATIAEKEQARAAILQLQASLIDHKAALAKAEAARQLAEALGPKGLQGEVVKAGLGPLEASVQAILDRFAIGAIFRFRTSSDRGREVFRFGWERDGRFLDFEALSTGQQLLTTVAVLVALLQRANPPLRVVALDNIEHLDEHHLPRMLVALRELRDAGLIDNVVAAGVVSRAVLERHPEALAGWAIHELGAGQEVAAGAARHVP